MRQDCSAILCGMNCMVCSRHRRKLSAKLSMITTPMLVLIYSILYLLLKFDKSFKYNEDIILKKDTTEKLLLTFLLPMAGLAMLSNSVYGLTVSEKRKKWKSGSQMMGLVCILTGAFTVSCFGILALYSTPSVFLCHPLVRLSMIQQVTICCSITEKLFRLK